MKLKIKKNSTQQKLLEKLNQRADELKSKAIDLKNEFDLFNETVIKPKFAKTT